MNDMQLRQSVIDQLNFEPSIDSADVGVAAEAGVVTLTGHLSSYPQKLAAERATWRVKGVKAIAQEIKVRFPSDKKHNDDEIAQRALKILEWNASVPKEAVRVKVQTGVIMLTGHLDWNYQREAAEAAVRRLDGVTGVINNIALKQAVQAADVKERITDALKRHAEVEASHVRVNVGEGGGVSLEGKVGSWDERRAVVYAAWSATGVRTVDDRMTIN